MSKTALYSRALRAALLLALAAAAGARAAVPLAGRGRAPAEAGGLGVLAQIEIDETHLRPAKRDLLLSDMRRLREMELEAEPGSWFDKLFGGRSTSDVLRYLVDRIRYIGEDLDDTARDRSETYAYNYAPSWLDYYYKTKVLNRPESRPDSVVFRDHRIPVLSPRTGLVVLGGAYSSSATLIDRVETLVHEARHSDCPRPPSREDALAFEKGHNEQMSDEGKACTNVHVKCPPGSDLAGEEACDAHPWGGYMAGWAFADSVFKYCRNCSEREKQEALATAADDMTRLSPELQHGLQDGTLPDPEMGSIQ